MEVRAGFKRDLWVRKSNHNSILCFVSSSWNTFRIRNRLRRSYCNAGEGTRAGLAAARARGCNGGRPKVTVDEARVVLAKKLHADKSLDIEDICTTLRISRSTLYRYVQL
ncbi:MAG: helix-turn-helix domain-containing protein [Planctomycetes bacterium]|nr:helix-turn-helix domain-containing protein [Planctomycetota bacterium]